MSFLELLELCGRGFGLFERGQRKLQESSRCRRAGKSVDLHRAKT